MAGISITIALHLQAPSLPYEHLDEFATPVREIGGQSTNLDRSKIEFQSRPAYAVAAPLFRPRWPRTLTWWRRSAISIRISLTRPVVQAPAQF